MDNARKKELLRTYKERKRAQGVYAVRCEIAELVWTAATRNLDTQQNQIWFVLRSGTHSNKPLQAAWNAHGADAFRYEILEVVEDENLQLIELLLKDREKHWRSQLSAEPLVG